MKRVFSVLALITVLTSCSKRDNPKPNNLVSINGTNYPTVVIGNQTWISVNYNGTGGVNYNDSIVNNPSYGKLYSIEEAKAIQLPTGWRLPSEADYINLIVSLGAKQVGPLTQDMGAYEIPKTTLSALMSTTGWVVSIGTNSSGFNAEPSGGYDGSYFDKGYDCILISPTNTGSQPNTFVIHSDGTQFSAGMSDIKDYNLGTTVYRGAVCFVKNN
jgi:uncharacterized protein (TIGR02145 family)